MQDSALDEAVALLRKQVGDQWERERDRRRLQQPRPLQLRWRPTSRPVQVAQPDWDAKAALRQGELLQRPGETEPAAHALVEAFHHSTRGQLVVLGEPGAGKSTLALLFALAVIESAPSGPVPVLLTLAGWNPSEPVKDWIASRISDDYPALSKRQAALLLKQQRILPVLDGLDEIHATRLETALDTLDDAAGSNLPMLITCRSAEYEQAVEEYGALSRAVVIEIDRIDLESAKMYLEDREVAGSNRWAPVIAAMEHDPKTTSARLLSTPLMLDLARRVYRKPDSRPKALTEFTTTEAAEHHLLDELIPNAYEDQREQEQARRWLGFLSQHLYDRVRTTNFEWWHLARAVPQWGIALVVTILFFVAAIPPFLSGFLTYYGFSAASLPVLVSGVLALAMMVGLHAGRSAHAVALPSGTGLAAVGGALRDLATFIIALCTIGTGALLIIYLVDPQTAGESTTSTLVAFKRGEMQEILVLLGGAMLGLSLFANVLNVRHGGRPQRSTPRLRTLIPNLAIGTGLGFALVSVVSMLVVGFAVESDGSTTHFELLDRKSVV